MSVFYRQGHPGFAADYGPFTLAIGHNPDTGAGEAQVWEAGPRIRIPATVAALLEGEGWIDDGPSGFLLLRIPTPSGPAVYRIVGFDGRTREHLAEWVD